MSETFGSRLKSLRKKAGLTQEELAEAIGVHSVTVSQWESDTYLPKTQNIKALAKALGVPENDLLNDTSPDGESGEWTIRINVADKFTLEVVDLKGNIQPVAQITATPDGLAFTIKAPWNMVEQKAGLEKLFKRILKESYPAMRGTGVALGGIKE
ncbi:MAG: helix-turn-helix transcriptional regulator [Synergistaceae bacterium]|nr:helix-turn-helix transcriptional regulator [Synergistaceae bacterium]